MQLRKTSNWLLDSAFVVFILLRGTLHALCGIRDGIQASLRNMHAAGFALTVPAVFDPLDCRNNLVEGVPLISQETQRKFLIEVATAKLGHVNGHAGRPGVILVQGIVFHLVHVALECCPQSKESVSMQPQVCFRHPVEPLQSNVVQEFS
jgi:hypothetical protein